MKKLIPTIILFLYKHKIISYNLVIYREYNEQIKNYSEQI